jgi:NAD(P) transhydrogenase subunit alpha
VLVGRRESRLSYLLGMLAVVAATSNIVGGFLITDRMLKMFKTSRPTKP